MVKVKPDIAAPSARYAHRIAPLPLIVPGICKPAMTVNAGPLTLCKVSALSLPQAVDNASAGSLVLWCASAGATVSNCVLAGNSAAYAGGGAYGGTLIDCTLVGNQARGDNGSENSVGGGANGAALIRCTIAGNSAEG